MPLVVPWYRGSGGCSRLVLGAIEAGHVMVENALELDGEGGLGDGKLSIESKSRALSLDIILEV